MPVFLKPIDMDAYYNSVAEDAVVANDLPVNSKDDKELVERLVLSVYDKTDIKFIASCSCGEKRGNYLIGFKCVACGTKVVSPTEHLSHRVWIRALPGTRFIDPVIWSMLTNTLRKNNYDVLQWLTNPSFRAPPRNVPALDDIRKAIPELKRDYTWFCDNFFTLLPRLFAIPRYRPKKTPDAASRRVLKLTKVIELYKDIVFCDYLPIPNKKMLVLEKSNKGSYVDFNIGHILDIVWTMALSKVVPLNPNKIGKQMSTVCATLTGYYKRYHHKFWRKKTGLPRRHVFSTRSFFSFRGVITQIDCKHHHQELHIPWNIGVTAFRPHILNRLIRGGMGLREATTRLYRAVDCFDPLLYSILEELISEAPRLPESPIRGIPALINRNPTLRQGSIHFLAITRVKKNPRDNTISFPIVNAKSKNADFDGDEENVYLILDSKLARLLATLAPHHNIMSDSAPLTISPNLFLPKPAVATIGNWLQANEKYDKVSDEELSKLKSAINDSC